MSSSSFESINNNSVTEVSTDSIRANPSSHFGFLVRIESVHLLIHHNSRIYRKLLAPEISRNANKFELEHQGNEHFIKTIRIIENCGFQFEFDFRLVTCQNLQQQQQHQKVYNQNLFKKDDSQINLLFHEFLQEQGKTINFYVENMGKFGQESSYRYTTTISSSLSTKSQSSASNTLNNRNLSLRLEICDLDRTAWFVGEWKIKFQSSGIDADNWLDRGTSIYYSNEGPKEKKKKIVDDVKESFDDFDVIDKEEFMSLDKSTQVFKLPSNYTSRTPSPLSQSSNRINLSFGINDNGIHYSSHNQSSDMRSIRSNSPSQSIAASFEDLNIEDFSSESAGDESLTLPRGSRCSLPDRLLLTEDLPLLPTQSRQNSLIPSRSGSPLLYTEDSSLSTVDIFHQVGSLFFSSSIGQLVTSTIKSDPDEQNLKTSYSTSTIHMLGVKYQLQGIQSNVFVMGNDENEGNELGIHEVTRIARFNDFSALVKRQSGPIPSKTMILREVLLLKRTGSQITNRLKNWFESFNWKIELFTPANLKVSNHFDVCIEVKIYTLKPKISSPSNTPELYLIELLLSRLGGFQNFKLIAEGNALFVELTAYIVQMESSETRKLPEIVLMEAWNSHMQPERLSQSESIPIVKYSVIPETLNSNFGIYVYFWSDHLQGWLLQNLTIRGMILSLHPLLDARMAIQINLSESHVKASQDVEGKIGNFTLITAQGQKFNFQTVQVNDLKEIIGRIRFAMLSRVPGPGLNRTRRKGSLLQANQIYGGTPLNSNSSGNNSNNYFSSQELERIRSQNMSVIDTFFEDFRSRFWFTYRRNFPRIEPSIFTTDLGWGCMLRTGQCLMAEALARFYFGRNWRLWQIEDDEGKGSVDNENIEDRVMNLSLTDSKVILMKQFYSKIVNQFIDQNRGEYSVHRLAIEGAKIGTPIGQWFGPSVLGKVLKSITNNLKDSPFWVYLSPDGTFPTDHILKIVSQRAALILLPLRLGIDSINPIYGNFIRGALRSSSSLGIVGGLPDKSLYFVGYQDWELLFLDPHILKPFDPNTFTDPDRLINEFHTSRVRSIGVEEIDPSMLFGFLCCSAEEVVQLRDHLLKLNRFANILSIKTETD